MTYKKREKIIVCSSCGSEWIHRDSGHVWNYKNQKWKVVALYDDYFCSKCNDKTDITELTLTSKDRKKSGAEILAERKAEDSGHS